MTTESAALPFEWRGRIPPDPLDLSAFEVTGPSGRLYRPHEGETLWVRVYGQNMSQNLGTVGVAADRFRAAMESNDNAEIEAAGLAMAEAVCARSIHIEATHPETGEPLAQPSEGAAAVYASWPSALLMWAFLRIVGVEGTVDRGNDSDASDGGSSETRAPRSRGRPR